MNGEKKYKAVEDLLTEDSFLAWYRRTSDAAIKTWEAWIADNPKHHQLAGEAVRLLELLVSVSENRVTEEQFATAKDRLIQTISEKEKQHCRIL